MPFLKGFLGFRSEKADGQRIFVDEAKEMKVMGVKRLLSYDQFGEEKHHRRKGGKDFKVNLINTVMVLRWDGRDHGRGSRRSF